MKALIVYDSTYGNTEKIARAIGAVITGEVKVLRAGEVSLSEVNSIDLLILGSPTQGGRPTLAMQEFVNKINVQGINIAVFDTRIPMKLGKLFGFAGDRIAKTLKAKDGNVVVSPLGFFVTSDKEPQLKEGELERAANWAKTLVK